MQPDHPARILPTAAAERTGACYGMSMLERRLQILIDEDRYRRLTAVARRRRVSVAMVVREAIDHDLGSPAMGRAAAARRFLEAPPMEVGDVDELLEELDALRARHG